MKIGNLTFDIIKWLVGSIAKDNIVTIYRAFFHDMALESKGHNITLKSKQLGKVCFFVFFTFPFPEKKKV